MTGTGSLTRRRVGPTLLVVNVLPTNYKLIPQDWKNLNQSSNVPTPNRDRRVVEGTKSGEKLLSLTVRNSSFRGD